jgi:L-iditol 2-dehydrogenase
MEISKDQVSRIVREVVSKAKNSQPATFPSQASKPLSRNSGRAAVLTAPENLEIKEFPLRDIRSDEILVKVEACGICGTDIHCYNSDPFGIAPVVLGHEGTGTVLEVGKDVRMDSVGKAVNPGDKIVTSVFEPSEECLIAKYNPRKANLADDLKIYGLLSDEPNHHFNGYFGEYLIIRPGSTFFVVNDMSLDLRVLIEPAAVVCHALERAKYCGVNLNFRSRVVVQGCGPIGLLMIAALRTNGINNIIAIDGDNDRLSMAGKLGADLVLNYKDFAGADDMAAKVYSLTKGVGAHFGFQVTGVPAAFGNLFKCIRRGGGIVEVGHFVDGGNCSINPHFDITRKEITVTGSWVYNSFEYPYAYHFLQRAERIGIPVTELITHRFPLNRIEEAFKTNLRQEGIKIVVDAQ